MRLRSCAKKTQMPHLSPIPGARSVLLRLVATILSETLESICLQIYTLQGSAFQSAQTATASGLAPSQHKG